MVYRSAELVALMAVSSTLFLFLHTQSLTSRLREMEVKLQPSELSASGLSGNSIIQGKSFRLDSRNWLLYIANAAHLPMHIAPLHYCTHC